MTLTDAGKTVATSVIEQFKSQPLCLALLLMNGALLYFIYHDENAYNQRAREVQDFLAKIIERCTSPAKTSYERMDPWNRHLRISFKSF